MKLLALDTATERCSAALWLDGEIRERSTMTRTGHSSVLLPMVGDLLAQARLALADLDGVAVDHGPGSFTGLRIGIGVGQGLAFGAGLPVVPVSSLAALARDAWDALDDQTGVDIWLLPALDARMDQVYWGAIRGDPGAWLGERGALIGAPGQVAIDGAPATVLGAGSGWDVHHRLLTRALERHSVRWLPGRFPAAGTVAAIAAAVFAERAVAAERLVPLYVRDEVAKRRDG